jgi:hypothetical protein
MRGDNMRFFPEIVILSGEGTIGQFEEYVGKDKDIERYLSKESCGGDRWARAYRLKFIEGSWDSAIYDLYNSDGIEDMRTIDFDQINFKSVKVWFEVSTSKSEQKSKFFVFRNSNGSVDSKEFNRKLKGALKRIYSWIEDIRPNIDGNSGYCGRYINDCLSVYGSYIVKKIK